MPGRPEADILAWLAEHAGATAFDVSRVWEMDLQSARSRLRHLERQKLITGRPNDAVPPYRVYAVTGEGRRRAAS